ncbi:MAG: hypothetical protein U0936_21430 [Planctomycetaceae bacterium]
MPFAFATVSMQYDSGEATMKAGSPGRRSFIQSGGLKAVSAVVGESTVHAADPVVRCTAPQFVKREEVQFRKKWEWPLFQPPVQLLQ